MKTNKTEHSRWQQFVSGLTMIAVAALSALTLSGCPSSSSDAAPPPATVAAPGAPTNFAIAQTANGLMSETLTWSPPTTGGAPASYEVYRSTTAGTAFLPENHIISLPATTYTFIDDAGLTNVDTYWVVSAKNAGGETPTTELMDRPTGDAVGFGNNFSAALIFADDIGIAGSGIPSTSFWTTNAASAVANTSTGLRPLSTQTVPVATLPYLDQTTVFNKNNTDYFPQQSSSTWQGEWALGAASGVQAVNAAWGDNLVSQSLTVNSKIRVEMVLTKPLSAPMTSYTMVSLYGAQANEIQGTDGATYPNSTAFVFASNVHLTIQKLDGSGNPDGLPLYDEPLWSAAGGTGVLAAEVNVAGNFTYGFVWDLKSDTLPPDITTGKAGTWRITFSLDNDNSLAKAAALALDGTIVPLASNNTNITTVSNGVLDTTNAPNNSAYIDINIGP